MLRLYPSFDGMMHDECQSSKVRWLKAPRIVAAEGTLHETVIERLKLDVAREYSGYKPYRPEPRSPTRRGLLHGTAAAGQDALVPAHPWFVARLTVRVPTRKRRPCRSF